MDMENNVRIEKIKDYFKKQVPEIISTIERVIPRKSELNNLYDSMWYHLDGGGKRLRPGLCILVAERFGVDVEKIMPYAASLEILHNFTLIHDDIEDSDRLRRDKPTVWVRYGIPHAINIGDGMFAKVYEMLLTSELSDEMVRKLINMLTETIMTIVEGQTMEMNFRGRKDVSHEEYLEMIWRKTGILFGAAMSGAALVAEKPESVQKILMEYGKLMGPAFQIRDDMIDIDKNARKGREVGADIKEGKRSIMVVHALDMLDVKESKKLLDILDKPKEETTEDDINWSINILNSCGAVEYAEKVANNFVEEAKRKLALLENQELKEELMTLADYVLSRKD